MKNWCHPLKRFIKHRNYLKVKLLNIAETVFKFIKFETLQLVFRKGHWKPGLHLPKGIRFPRSQQIDNETIFIFGEDWKFSNATRAYLYNQSIMEFTDLSHGPCNIKSAAINGQYSSAYLKRDHLVIIAIEDCGATMNLTSLSWASFPLPKINGILFNEDWTYKNVYYLSSHEDSQSAVYLVLTKLVTSISYLTSMYFSWGQSLRNGYF